MHSLISAENISVIRERKHILKDISFEIAAREFLTVIGPNGAGKSMLLKCLMEFYKPDSGSIKRNPDLTIGYLPQQFVVDRTMPITVERFLCLRRQTNQVELDRVIAETQIESLLERPLFVLSGGQTQRVLLARALLDQPNLLILDEPAQNLDVSGQLGFYKLIERVHAERELSVLMVSHDLHLVMSSTQKVICLYHHICCSGEPQAVARDPEFISLFGNDMAKLMSVYHHSHDHQHDHLHKEHHHA